MTTLELTLQIIAFGLAWWLGLYLISRNPRSVRLLLAGLGLVTYSVGLVLDLLARFAPVQLLVDTLFDWQRPFMYLPALFWLGLLIAETRSEIPWPDRLRRQPRSAGALIAATIFFALGFGFMLFPINWLPRLWLLLGIGLDLLLLGIAIAFFDAFDEGETLLPHFIKAFDYALLTALVFGGQVALVMVLSTGITLPMLLLLMTTIGAAIVIQVFAGAAQILVDRIAFSPFPQIRQQRATLRAVDEASQRSDSRRSPSPSDEAEFARLTRRALSQMGNLPKLAASPLTRLPIIEHRLINQDVPADTLSRAAELKALLVESIDRLKPQNQGDFGSTDEWRHYNA